MAVEFSIIIPAYNEEESITATLQSIIMGLGENRNRFEILIIDGNSSDRTVSAANDYLSDKGMESIIVPLKEKSFPGNSRNEGVEKSNCENLIFIDCGIRVDKDFFDVCMENANKYDTIWFESGFDFVEETDLSYIRPYFSGSKNRRYLRHCLINKRVFELTGFFNSELRATEDWLFYKEVQKLHLSELFSNTKAVYSGYPKGLGDFYRKWTVYFEQSVYSGFSKRNIRHIVIQTAFVALVFIGLFHLSFKWIWALVLSALTFIIVRGIFSFLRSRIHPMSMLDFLYTFVTSSTLELSRVIGIIIGSVRKKV